MKNVNVFDIVLVSIEEHNTYVNRYDRKDTVKKLTHSELTGLFYNTFRRNLGYLGNIRNPYNYLRASELHCKFSPKGEIIDLKVTKDFTRYGWEHDVDNFKLFNELKDICKSFKKFYPTKVLNEMAFIVNSIN